jgi:hypothetical protein
LATHLTFTLSHNKVHMSYSSILKKYVKARYGNWLLVQLPSGSWASIWAAALGLEDMCEVVVTGTPRFDGDSLALSYATRSEALQRIVSGIEHESRNNRGQDAETMKPFLKKARLALLREGQRSQA